jgi:hypothetical protein
MNAQDINVLEHEAHAAHTPSSKSETTEQHNTNKSTGQQPVETSGAGTWLVNAAPHRGQCCQQPQSLDRSNQDN